MPWPRCTTPLAGFCAMVAGRPPLVQNAATSDPTETSRNCRKPAAFCAHGTENPLAPMGAH